MATFEAVTPYARRRSGSEATTRRSKIALATSVAALSVTIIVLLQPI